MASPSSSSTTPSPPMAYISAPTQQHPSTQPLDDAELAERQQAVQKFLARVKLSELARNLRTRLSYATYKATHNVAHLPFRDLEASARLDPSSTARSGRGNNHYDNPNTQGRNLMAQAQAQSAQRNIQLGPPSMTPGSSGRPQTPAQLSKDAPTGANAAQSLYASILAQAPPSMPARSLDLPAELAPSDSAQRANGSSSSTRHHASSSHAHTSERSRHRGHHHREGEHTSLVERTRTHSRATEPVASSSTSGVKRKAASSGRSSRDKPTKRRRANDPSELREMDMRAAATLTEFFRSSRSSMVTSAASPRSSLSGGSDGGSFTYAQSSARTQPPPVVGSPTGTQPVTPPQNQALPIARSGSHLTATSSIASVRPPPDQEAIKLLQFLHESPSPARATRDAQDAAAFRTLSGSQGSAASGSNELHATGRVLFPTASGGAEPPRRPLSRGAGGSFASTASTASGYIPAGSSFATSAGASPHLSLAHLEAPMRPLSPSPKGPTTRITPPTPTEDRSREHERGYAYDMTVPLARAHAHSPAPVLARGVAGLQA